MKKKISKKPAFVINFFQPFRIYPPSTFSAVVIKEPFKLINVNI